MGARAWALRRVMGRLRITDDIVRHLSTFQRLGEMVEVQLPGELLPVGARTAFRALRTRAAAQLGVDWIWPHWLVRQVDPSSPAFIPRGHMPFLANVTLRNWTMVGNIGSPWEAIVDPRGLITPWYDGWSLDWWVGGDDRWHFPSVEVGVRQRLIGSAPVVETAMSIPGGDAIQRVYAIRTRGQGGGDELVMVEIENRSRLPFALALAVRPYNPEGLAVVERISIHDHVVVVDGRPALVFPRAPSAMAGSTFHGGDSALVVTRGRAGPSLPDPLRCDAGLAQAAFVFPLAHTATFRVAIPLVPERRTRRRRLARRRVEQAPELPPRVPSAQAVAKSWEAQANRGLRLELPDQRLREAVDANRRFLLLFHDGADITPGPSTYHRFWFRDAAFMLAALDRYGLHAQAAEVLASYPHRQHVDGFFFSQRQEWDSNGTALWALAEHWRLTGDDELARACVGAVSKGVRWIDRTRRSKRRKRASPNGPPGVLDPALEGLMPPGISAEHLGPFDYFYWDSFWSWRGLLDGALLLEVAGRREAASISARWAGELQSAIERSLSLVAERLGTWVMPAGPRRHIDPAIISCLVACQPLGLLPAHDLRIAATADALRERFCIGDAFYQSISHTGLGTYLTIQLAMVELEAGDRRALRRLRWMLDVATPTFTWPEAIHPRLGGGCMGDGQHGWAAAEFLSLVRNMLVRETPDGLAMCSMLPDDWVGQGVEVHNAPTHHGRLSFALRWHGERPALLWELEPHSSGPGRLPVPRLTAPGLDSAWSSTELRGEALLAPPAVAAPTAFG